MKFFSVPSFLEKYGKVGKMKFCIFPTTLEK